MLPLLLLCNFEGSQHMIVLLLLLLHNLEHVVSNMCVTTFVDSLPSIEGS